MFKKFSLKIRINVISIVCLMLAIQFVLTYILFFSIFTEDFKQKANELSSQISNHVTLRLQYVEEATRLFCNENNIASALENFDSTMVSNMGKLTAITDDIQGCFILGKEQSYFSLSAYRRSFRNLAVLILPEFSHTGKSGYWYICDVDDDEQGTHLIYSHVIRDDNQNPIGMVSVDVSPDNLYRATELFDTELMEYTTVYLSSNSGKQKIFFYDTDKSSVSAKDSKSHAKKYHYADSIHINTISSVEYIQSKLRFIVFIMITIFAVALILLFIVLYVYSRHLTKRMTELAYKMNNFIDRN